MVICAWFMSEKCTYSTDASDWRMLDFFAGSGLVSYGMKNDFNTVWANDISAAKASIYKANLKADTFLHRDIKDVSGESLPHAHMSWASFPCQDLSLAGLQGGIHAKRSGLVWEWLRILDEIQDKPRVLVLENVIGLVSSKRGENYRVLHQALLERGYKAGAIVVNASEFLPQSRPRVFIIAVEKSLQIPEELVTSSPSWLHPSAVVELGNTLTDWVWWSAPRPDIRRVSLEQIIDWSIPFDKDSVVKLIPDCHLRKFWESSLRVVTGYRRSRLGKQQLELRMDGIAGCLRTPGGGSSKQFIVAKRDDGIHARLLTVREAARLMGAPDAFELPGSANDGYMAMGDAVAMPVAAFLSKSFLKKLVVTSYE